MPGGAGVLANQQYHIGTCLQRQCHIHCLLLPHSAKMNKYAAVVVNMFAGEIQAEGWEVGQE